jgi:hypothetical protein
MGLRRRPLLAFRRWANTRASALHLITPVVRWLTKAPELSMAGAARSFRFCVRLIPFVGRRFEFWRLSYWWRCSATGLPACRIITSCKEFEAISRSHFCTYDAATFSQRRFVAIPIAPAAGVPRILATLVRFQLTNINDIVW